jgi:hypothetical protein
VIGVDKRARTPPWRSTTRKGRWASSRCTHRRTGPVAFVGGAVAGANLGRRGLGRLACLLTQQLVLPGELSVTYNANWARGSEGPDVQPLTHPHQPSAITASEKAKRKPNAGRGC